MITCAKCNEVNAPEASVCQKCGQTLLPGESLKDRLIYFIGGILGCVLSLVMTYVLGKNPELAETGQCCLLTKPELWLFGIIGFPIAGLVSLIRRTPDYRRYEMRANRHLEIDPEQALADISKALMMAPEKQKASLLKQRSQLFTKLGQEESALQDKIEYLAKDEAFEGTSAFAQTFGLDKDTMIEGARAVEQMSLIQTGKVNAIGFCMKCQKAVILNEKSRCPLHPKIKPMNESLVLADNVEMSLFEVERKSLIEYKKIKRNRTVLLIIMLVVITLCILIPVITSLFK